MLTNTLPWHCVQLATVSGFLLHAAAGWPPLEALNVAAAVTAGTTVISGAAYVRVFFWDRHAILR